MIFLSALFASFFGLGYLPFMPGTWGTLGACFLGFLLIPSPPVVLLLISLFTTLFGWYVSHNCLKATAHADMDPSWIVIDEVAGYFWTLFVVSCFTPLTSMHLLLAFIFFRILDITKPWPISWIDRFMAKSPATAGLGIMLDDVIAGLLAAFFVLFSYKTISVH